jgi:hypothetical protein
METAEPKITIPPPEVLRQYQREADHEFKHRFARELHFDRRRREFRLGLNSGVTFTIPVAKIHSLAAATPAQLGRVKLSGAGGALELRELDLDISVPGLIRNVLGFGEIQQSRAGRVRTPKKAAAARANGAKGGRPRRKTAA